jgi:hypothetical protein
MRLLLPRLAFLTVALALVARAAPATAPVKSSRVFELRTYTAAPGKLDALLARFRNHTVKLFEKHGMKNVGYWTPLDDADGKGTKLVYLLSHSNREEAARSWKAFIADPAWQKAKAESEVAGSLVAGIESVYLVMTDYSPAPPVSAAKGGADRVFELRTYRTPEGRLPALDGRFRDHTVALFAKHGMTNLWYFHPTDADKGAGTTLVYFLAHASREAAAASFKAFRTDPAWIEARATSEAAAGGSLTLPAPNGVKSVFLAPVDFSAVR